MLHSCWAVAGALLILPPATAGAQQLDQLRGPAPLVEEARAAADGTGREP